MHVKLVDSIPRINPTLPDGERDHIKGSVDAQGSVDAPIALLEYGSYECSLCGQAHTTIKVIQSILGDRLCFAFRHFPLTSAHPHSEHAAEAAGAQGRSWEMHDILFKNQHALGDENLAEYAVILGLNEPRLISEVLEGAYMARLREDFRIGVRAGVESTPIFFINGARYVGPHSFEPLHAALTLIDASCLRQGQQNGDQSGVGNSVNLLHKRRAGRSWGPRKQSASALAQSQNNRFVSKRSRSNTSFDARACLRPHDQGWLENRVGREAFRPSQRRLSESDQARMPSRETGPHSN
jgi:hypothetical protein